jgi:hypothetical protein
MYAFIGKHVSPIRGFFFSAMMGVSLLQTFSFITGMTTTQNIANYFRDALLVNFFSIGCVLALVFFMKNRKGNTAHLIYGVLLFLLSIVSGTLVTWSNEGSFLNIIRWFGICLTGPAYYLMVRTLTHNIHKIEYLNLLTPGLLFLILNNSIISGFIIATYLFTYYLVGMIQFLQFKSSNTGVYTYYLNRTQLFYPDMAVLLPGLMWIMWLAILYVKQSTGAWIVTLLTGTTMYLTSYRVLSHSDIFTEKKNTSIINL